MEAKCQYSCGWFFQPDMTYWHWDLARQLETCWFMGLTWRRRLEFTEVWCSISINSGGIRTPRSGSKLLSKPHETWGGPKKMENPARALRQEGAPYRSSTKSASRPFRYRLAMKLPIWSHWDRGYRGQMGSVFRVWENGSCFVRCLFGLWFS